MDIGHKKGCHQNFSLWKKGILLVLGGLFFVEEGCEAKPPMALHFTAFASNIVQVEADSNSSNGSQDQENSDFSSIQVSFDLDGPLKGKMLEYGETKRGKVAALAPSEIMAALGPEDAPIVLIITVPSQGRVLWYPVLEVTNPDSQSLCFYYKKGSGQSYIFGQEIGTAPPLEILFPLLGGRGSVGIHILKVAQMEDVLPLSPYAAWGPLLLWAPKGGKITLEEAGSSEFTWQVVLYDVFPQAISLPSGTASLENFDSLSHLGKRVNGQPWVCNGNFNISWREGKKRFLEGSSAEGSMPSPDYIINGKRIMILGQSFLKASFSSPTPSKNILSFKTRSLWGIDGKPLHQSGLPITVGDSLSFSEPTFVVMGRSFL